MNAHSSCTSTAISMNAHSPDRQPARSKDALGAARSDRSTREAAEILVLQWLLEAARSDRSTREAAEILVLQWLLEAAPRARSYDKESKTGGSNGATMRYKEGDYGANAGLKVARDLLEPIKAKFPWISYADLWTLGGVTSIEEMGGDCWAPCPQSFLTPAEQPSECQRLCIERITLMMTTLYVLPLMERRY